jgi:RNA polymerase subunit RPABC4/transcription elongation factor Spt4
VNNIISPTGDRSRGEDGQKKEEMQCKERKKDSTRTRWINNLIIIHTETQTQTQTQDMRQARRIGGEG